VFTDIIAKYIIGTWINDSVWRVKTRNEMALICVKFGADLISISKATSRKTVVPFYAPPCVSFWCDVFAVNKILCIITVITIMYFIVIDTRLITK